MPPVLPAAIVYEYFFDPPAKCAHLFELRQFQVGGYKTILHHFPGQVNIATVFKRSRIEAGKPVIVQLMPGCFITRHRRFHQGVCMVGLRHG